MSYSKRLQGLTSFNSRRGLKIIGPQRVRSFLRALQDNVLTTPCNRPARVCRSLSCRPAGLVLSQRWNFAAANLSRNAQESTIVLPGAESNGREVHTRLLRHPLIVYIDYARTDVYFSFNLDRPAVKAALSQPSPRTAVNIWSAGEYQHCIGRIHGVVTCNVLQNSVSHSELLSQDCDDVHLGS